MLNLIACAPILTAWLAVCGTWYQSRRQARREQVEWEQLSPALSQLDADLDRTWVAEEERIRRYR